MRLLHFKISLILVCGISRSFESRYAVIPMGFMNSSSSTSPGWIFSSLSMISFMIIHNFYFKGVTGFPNENHTPLIINTNAIKVFAITA